MSNLSSNTEIKLRCQHPVSRDCVSFIGTSKLSLLNYLAKEFFETSRSADDWVLTSAGKLIIMDYLQLEIGVLHDADWVNVDE